MMRWGLLKGGILMTVMKWEHSCAGGVCSWAGVCVCLVYLEPHSRAGLQGEDSYNTRPWREIVQGVGGGHSGSERGWMGTGRGNRTAPDLSPGTAQPWVVITNHTSHFWGDTLPPRSHRWVLKVRRPESGELACSSLVRSKNPTAASAAGPPIRLDPRLQGQ